MEASTSRFERLARWSLRHGRAAVAVWLAVLIGVSLSAGAIGSDYHNDHTLPGTESQETHDLLAERAPARAGDTVDIVFQAEGGLVAPPVRERVEKLVEDVGHLPSVADARSPYAGPGTISEDGTIGYATVALTGTAEDVPKDDVVRIIDSSEAAAGDGLRIELGGDAVRTASESEGGGAEGAGILAALVVLVLLFGSLLAASLPVITAIFAVGTTIGLIGLASHVATIADYTPPIMMLVGLGVGIDYALLIFARFRGELLAGRDRDAALRVAVDTAGRTVFFAALTVIIALLGLFALGLGSLQGVALGVSLTVLLTMVASLTLLPALLGLMGRRIERSVQRRASRAKRADGDGWRRWSGKVARRPWQIALGAVLLLLALAIPALDMRIGFADASTDPETATARQAHELLAEGFGPGFSGPLVVAAELPAGAAGDTAADELTRTLEGTPGVASVVPAERAAGDVATAIAFPTTRPQDAATADLVERLREDVLPPLERSTGARFLVGGETAATVDFSLAIAAKMPVFVLVVVGLSALLLAVVFRSIAIPIKAAVFNLLSIGASYGVITLVFQEGFLAGPLGVETGPIEAFLPVMIFAIVFGLSMDYEMFLVSRMHEEWEKSREAARAVGEGLATTGRVVTAAAAIMIVVFGAFLLSPERMLQTFGLGLAAAILIDALVIRCLLLPAVMHLLGARAWWMPRGLARRLPRVAIERA